MSAFDATRSAARNGGGAAAGTGRSGAGAASAGTPLAGTPLAGARGAGAALAAGLRTPAWLGALAIALLVAFSYAPTFRTLWRTWMHNGNYSHGVLIPPVALLLLWMRRNALRASPREPSALGLPLIALGLALQVGGLRGDLTMVQGHSFVLVVLGLILHFFGRSIARIAFFPVAYLVFMSPFPPVFADEISFRLKVWVINVALGTVGALGVPVVREGMTLHLPAGAVSIEDPCSGLRSLIALLAMATLVAGLARPGAGLARRAALVCAAIPVAVFANFVRITLIVLASNYLGIELGTGIVHDVSGYVLFAVGLAGLLAVRAAIRC